MTISPVSEIAMASIAEVDPDIWAAMQGERRRQHDKIELIASENYVSAAVMEAQGSWLTNKYAEGLPGKRYYGGCEFVDIAERLAQERALALYPGSEHVNVQPHSGAQANMVAYFSVINPGDRILGMSLAHGGHLTHGMALNFSGRLYEVHAYGVRQDTERIDYDALEAQAKEVRPKVIIGGASAYPRLWDFERMADIAHGVGAVLFVDMAHIAGLVAADVHPSPFPHADLVTTTTHKTLRGPRGGMIFSRNELPPSLNAEDFPAVKGSLAASVDRNVFPGTQGGPLMQVIAGKAVAFKLAAGEPFREDQRRTVANAAVMAETVGEPRRPRGLGRHRQPPPARRRHPARRDRQGGGAPARRDRDHRQQERHPVRHPASEHRLRHPHRDAGDDLARVRRGRDAPGRPDHHRGDPRPRRRGGPGAPGRRRPRDRRPVPRPRPGGRVRSASASLAPDVPMVR